MIEKSHLFTPATPPATVSPCRDLLFLSVLPHRGTAQVEDHADQPLVASFKLLLSSFYVNARLAVLISVNEEA